jgi:hypothetical protein
MGIPSECQSIQDQIALVEGKVQETLEQLVATAPAERPTLFQQLKSLTASLHDLQDSLGSCIVNSHQVQGILGGTGTIVIRNQQGSGNVACSTLLDSARTTFTLRSFPTNSYNADGDQNEWWIWQLR